MQCVFNRFRASIERARAAPIVRPNRGKNACNCRHARKAESVLRAKRQAHGEGDTATA